MVLSADAMQLATRCIVMYGFFARYKHMVNMYYQAGVCGIKLAWSYFKHEILNIKDKITYWRMADSKFASGCLYVYI